MQAKQKQLSLIDIYSDLEQYLIYDKPKLLKLLEEHINLDKLIPYTFYSNYNKTTGHPSENLFTTPRGAFPVNGCSIAKSIYWLLFSLFIPSPKFYLLHHIQQVWLFIRMLWINLTLCYALFTQPYKLEFVMVSSPCTLLQFC